MPSDDTVTDDETPIRPALWVGGNASGPLQRWAMAVGAVYLPWLFGMAPHLVHNGGFGPGWFPGIVIASVARPLVGQGAGLLVASALVTLGLIVLARRLLDGGGYGFLIFFGCMLAMGLGLSRLLSF